MSKPTYFTNLDKLEAFLPEEKRIELRKVTDRYAFRINDYYANLIDWSDPHDPIRKLVIPGEGELKEYGRWDASDEEANYVVPGCQHKYGSTALLVVSEVCAAYCRYCFRKRLFQQEVHEASANPEPGLAYIAAHPEISNVLLTGGDSLMLSTKRLIEILAKLREIPHVQIIRLGSKMPVFQPMRIYEDEELLTAIRNYSTPEKRIYIMAHVNHPRELTAEARTAFRALLDAGAVVMNQTPILRGINDDPAVLADLLDRLSWSGIAPYYFFINRPVAGNSEFVLSLENAYRLVEEAKARTSGLGKRVRLVMSHSSGKIEILAIENGKAYLKYHQSREGHYGKLMILDCPPGASWFDDLPGNERYWNAPGKKHHFVMCPPSSRGKQSVNS
ncbi:KamA family radical SAM protein [Gorillibacterium timonense]|uniref:KamA family radical SAM protein n=1 Tax=Gorillibacterium timonense TaxID=1689269 RepID=UPI00071E578C|nr:KamA family radical SAM protein [Gorillibacterium timonense]